MSSPIIGSVKERSSDSNRFTPPELTSSPATGFPIAQHRLKTKSAFRLAREAAKGPKSSTNAPPIVSSSAADHRPNVTPNNRTTEPALHNARDPHEWRKGISQENERIVENMSEKERDEERNEILSRFGSGVVDILRRARDAREKLDKEDQISSGAKPESPFQSGYSTPTRKLRFADVTADSIHVYESQPSSPRRVLGLLPPIEPVASSSSGQTSPPPGEIVVDPPTENPPLDEPTVTGTPDDIRRRFFPTESAANPSLEWMNPSIANGSESSDVRFDLSGAIIPPHMSESLPTHLGLHHHAGTQAGYTLDNLFLLSRSTVPAQRCTMLAVLAKIVYRMGKGELPSLDQNLRTRILAAGAEAFAEPGNINVVSSSVDVMWEAIVGWDQDYLSIPGCVLSGHSENDAVSTLPLDSFLPLVVGHFANPTLDHYSISRLLSILHRLSVHSIAHATAICSTSELIPAVLRLFLLDPPSTPRNPAAILLLQSLALSSRSNAESLLPSADTLLRFIVILPDSDAPSCRIVTETLRFYTILAKFGLYSNVATTAAEQLASLSSFLISSASSQLGSSYIRDLIEAWLAMLDLWTICAVNPHKTSPPHDILWSQVTGWGWSQDVFVLRSSVVDSGVREGVEGIWAAIWNFQMTWLEGSTVNGIKGGQEERLRVVESFHQDWMAGDRHVFECAVARLSDALAAWDSKQAEQTLIDQLRAIAREARVVAAGARVILACFPEVLPVNHVGVLFETLLSHPLWSDTKQFQRSYPYTLLRPLSSLLVMVLRLLRQNGAEPLAWIANATSVLSKLLPGDEPLAAWIFREIIQLFDITLTLSLQWHIPEEVWVKGGGPQVILVPFLLHSLRPKGFKVYVGPSSPIPESIAFSTTQSLPHPTLLDQPPRQTGLGLPLPTDWMTSPITDLLRSGTSSADFFKTLPPGWDASEADVVRCTLLLTHVLREAVLRLRALPLLSREEAIFACMRVFMLEHGQTAEPAEGEVFRDPVVEKYMTELLAPSRFSASISSVSTLESVSHRFLGSQQPFFQFYSDFVALYDAISFSNSLFGLLLLPPTSMKYPLDYRKLLWGDYNHVLRNIRVDLHDVLADNLGDWLWPIETDGEMVGNYLKALLTGPLSGFLRFIAIHHVACNIWPDLGENDVETRQEQVFKAVLSRGRDDVLRDVFSYHQHRNQPQPVFPPACFQSEESSQDRRLQLAVKWGGDPVKRRLRG